MLGKILRHLKTQEWLVAQMSKIKEAVDNDGKVVRWLFCCPGCGEWHGIDETWEFNGNKESPTISPSVLVLPSANGYIKRCHSFVRDGKIEFLGDSDHKLAGQTVELLEVES